MTELIAEEAGWETGCMAVTAVGSDSVGPEGVPGCWCCGDRTVQTSLLRLGEHPEVGVCFSCVRVLARRKRAVERQTTAAPAGWPLWRRVQYRAGFGRC
jgi:hypothetical protein